MEAQDKWLEQSCVGWAKQGGDLRSLDSRYNAHPTVLTIILNDKITQSSIRAALQAPS